MLFFLFECRRNHDDHNDCRAEDEGEPQKALFFVRLGVGEAAGRNHHVTLADTKRVPDMFPADKNIFAPEYIKQR